MPLDPSNAHPGLQSFGALLTWQAAREPDRPALTFEGETLSRLQLDRAVNRMARALAAEGVRADDFVALVLPNGFAYTIFTYAIWKLGATPAPIPTKAPDAELQAMVALVGPRLVIGPTPERVPGFATLPADYQPAASLSDAPLPDITSRVWKASTSGGSTGRPKIILDGKPGMTDPDVRLPVLMMEREDVMLNPAPMYHNGPFTNVHWALAWGCHVIEMARFDPLEWLRLVERHRVRWAYMVPTMMNRIWALPEEVRNGFDLSSLRVVMHMAAPCPQWLKEAWINWLGPQKIWEVYAGTEAFAGSVISGEAWLTHRGSVGVPGTPTAILDADGEPLPTGEIGEIYFRNPNGPGTTFVYRGAEASRRGDWETYGDMGYLDDEGYLYLADRRTDMIISGGANIFPAEVESALEQHPAIASAVVVGLPDHDLGARVHAVLEPRSGQSEPAPGDVIAFLRERLAGYKLPYTYDIVDQPLRDDAGKVRRALVRDSRIARRDAGETFPTLRGA